LPTIRLVFFCLILLSNHKTLAQDYYLKTPTATIIKTEVQDSIALSLVIQKWKVSQWRIGYPFASLDSVVSDTVYLYRGSKETVVIDTILYANGESKRVKIKKPWKGISHEIDFWTNHGYPFMEIFLFRKGVKYQVFIDRGPQINYDSVSLDQDIIAPDILERTLEIEHGKPYSERNFKSLENSIQRLSFLRLKSKPTIYFENGLASVGLELVETQTNTFEGVVGLLPKQSAEEDILITGFLDIQLINLFKSAKSLNMSWNRFGDQSQVLDLEYFHPFIAGSPLLFQFKFNLLKQDTTFLNQEATLGLGTYLGKGQLLFEYSRRSGTVINQNNQNDITETLYPSTINLYTIIYQGASLNRPFGFTDKFDFEAGLSFGTKALENDNSTTTQDLKINDVSDIFELKIKVRNQIALSKRLKLFDEFRVESFRNGQVFINERYRIGGLNSLRGFNENYFFIESFIINRLELRQYFESRSFFYLFHDIMFAKSNAAQISPFGFGVGFSLQTKTGLLNFALALGKEQKRPIAPSESKVHIGFISKF